MSKAYMGGQQDPGKVKDEYTTIRVSKETKERLRGHGEMGMSYEEVIQDILERLGNEGGVEDE